MKYLLSLFFVFALIGCGYKPSAKYARKAIGEKISTEVIISLPDPENTVLIKDALDLAIIQVFHASIANKKDASSHLTISLGEVTYFPTQYDADGYIVSYRTTIRLLINKTANITSKNYSAIGTYDFSIAPNSIITDRQRFDAIKFSAIKAIESFVGQVAAEGAIKQ